jgi:hypothetical protein
MKIAFVHYHLRPGGFATVIRRQMAALAGVADCLGITGEAPHEDFPGDIVVVPGIKFSELVGAAACMLTTSITEGFGFAFLEPWTVLTRIAPVSRRIW